MIQDHEWLVHVLEGHPRDPNRCGLGIRPSFYSGRGAREGDLNGEMLLKIHRTIVEHVSADAGEAFVAMVLDLDVLSATAFLVALGEFSDSWVWDGKPRKGKHVAPDDMDSAMASALEVMGGSLDGSRDDTLAIRAPFLRALGVVDPRAPEGRWTFSDYERACFMNGIEGSR